MAKALFTATESFASCKSANHLRSAPISTDRPTVSRLREMNSGARMSSEAWSGSLLGHDTIRSKFGEKIWFILHNQRESTTGATGGGGRGTDDDCTADDCALGCGGLRCGIGAACWDGDGGVDEILCLMSSSTACSVAMFWAI